MSADQIFVLVLVVGSLLLIGGASWDTHQRAKVEEQPQSQAGPDVPRLAAEDVRPSARTRRQRQMR